MANKFFIPLRKLILQWLNRATQYIGSFGEIQLEPEKWRLIGHDGVTPGGIPFKTDVNDVLRIAKVAVTNNYNDLFGLPTLETYGAWLLRSGGEVTDVHPVYSASTAGGTVNFVGADGGKATYTYESETGNHKITFSLDIASLTAIANPSLNHFIAIELSNGPVKITIDQLKTLIGVGTNYWSKSVHNLYPTDSDDNVALGASDSLGYKLRVAGLSYMSGIPGSGYAVHEVHNNATTGNAIYADGYSSDQPAIVGIGKNIGAYFASYNTLASAIDLVLQIVKFTSGTPSAGIGCAVDFQIQSSSSIPQSAGRISVWFTNATTGSQNASMGFMLDRAGTLTTVVTFDEKGNIKATGSLQIADDSDSASAGKAGTLRYTEGSNYSRCEMCMKTGASSYAWVIIKENTW